MEDVLAVISFMSLFGRQLIGLKIDADFLYESLQVPREQREVSMSRLC